MHQTGRPTQPTLQKKLPRQIRHVEIRRKILGLHLAKSVFDESVAHVGEVPVHIASTAQSILIAQASIGDPAREPHRTDGIGVSSAAEYLILSKVLRTYRERIKNP